MKIKLNDKVKILSGKDRGKIAKVIQVFPKDNRVVVEGVNQIKKHLRAKSKTEKGQVIELSAPLQANKVLLVCPKCEKSVRVGYTMQGDKKTRICRKCKEVIE
jgi:large subunit ribosomal protein L24